MLLYKLFEKGKIKRVDEDYYEKIMDLLDNIKHDIDGNIQKNKLEKFLRNDEKIIKQRLSLIKIILECLILMKFI